MRLLGWKNNESYREKNKMKLIQRLGLMLFIGSVVSLTNHNEEMLVLKIIFMLLGGFMFLIDYKDK